MEARELTQMRIESVRVEGRYRKDLGDVESLAKSIAEGGLINPITVTPDGQLIAGQRRLEACRSLGWETVPALVASDLDEAVAKLRAERDENEERKEMLVSERVALAEALQELERPKAAERKREASRKGGLSRHGLLPADNIPASPPIGGKAGESSRIAGAAVGLPGGTLARARMVIKSANDPDLPPAIRDIAKQAAADMDATGKVSGNYERVRRAKAGEEAPPPPRPHGTNGRKRRPLTDAAHDAGWKLRKEVEKVERVISDDRYTTHKEEVATHLRGHLTYTLETAQRLLNILDKENSSEQ